ncbi:TPA: type II secretion system F family protein [Klebsiella oxytoca]|nr:type II secretion system F family protein [Klebsiella oxytoca]
MITLLITLGVVFTTALIFVVLSLSWPPLMRRTFWLPERIRFWQMTRTLWRMGMKPAELFDTLTKMYSENGRHRNRGSLLCTQMTGAFNKRTFGELGLPGPQNKVARPEDVLALWCSPLEAVLFRVGNVTGNMSDALAQSVSLLEYTQEMRRAMLPAVARAAMLLPAVPGILWGVSEKMLPAVTGLIPPERWTVHIRLLSSVSNAIQNHGLVIGLACLVLGVICIRSVPRKGGMLRRRLLEKLPPWSVYATLQGILFLLSTGALVKAGMNAREVLETLRSHASPWLVARLDAAAFLVRSGRNLGQALYESGYQFPSTQSAIFLNIAGASRDIAGVMTDWGQAQMPEALNRIKAISNTLVLIMGAGIAVFLIYVMFAVFGLTMSIKSQGL